MRSESLRSRRGVSLRPKCSRSGASVSAARAGVARILLLFLIGLALSAVIQAQQISGSIVSDADGKYLFPSLPAGQHTIDAKHRGSEARSAQSRYPTVEPDPRTVSSIVDASFCCLEILVEGRLWSGIPCFAVAVVLSLEAE
jgi:hypothetical protein